MKELFSTPIKQESLQLTGGNFNNNRRELDFYPTPKEVTIALMEYLNLPPRRIWEPACGNGAMSKVLESYRHTVISSDISGSSYGIENLDFLSDTFQIGEVDAIITNPPFNLSEDFIRKSLKEARLVAMVLKSQYWHAAKRLKLFQEFPPSHVLPLTWRPDFLEHERTDGKKGSPTMEVCWTVWDKSANHMTVYHPLTKPKC